MKIWLLALTLAVISLFLLIKYDANQEIANFRYIARRILTKPDVAYQGALVVTPDGSAYIPIIFKDEIAYNEYFKKTDKQWSDEGFLKQGYYAIDKIQMPYEYKRNSKIE